MEQVTLREHFTYPKLIRFVLPSISMMVITSIYTIVDGFFVSNFAGKTGFAALNLIFPVISIVSSVGFMIGAGGSSLVAFTLGQKKHEKAEEIFSMLIVGMFLVAIFIGVVACIYMPQIASFLGATEDMMYDAMMYGRISVLAMPFFMLQNAYQSFCVTAQKARLGLMVTVVAGVMNIMGDYALVYVLHMGTTGAAIATGTSQCVGAIIPTLYFLGKNDSLLHFRVFRWNIRTIGKACSNGASEMVSNIAASVVAMVYNFELMSLAGEDGIAIYGVLMYVCFLFCAVFFGMSMGITPIVGYQCGANRIDELHNVFCKSLVLSSVLGVLMFGMCQALAPTISHIYVGYDPSLCIRTIDAFRIYAYSFLFFGYNIFASAFFTGLSNGRISACISFMRTFVTQIVAVLVLPMLLGVEGIWWAVVVSELVTLFVSVYFFWSQKRRYHY